MFSWFDLLLAAILIWTTISGYLDGVKKACLSAFTWIGVILLPLPFAANCGGYLRPIAQPVFLAAMGEKVVTASSSYGQLGFLGPWQGHLGIRVGQGKPLIDGVINFAVNLTGLSFLVIVLSLTAFLLKKITPRSRPARLGGIIGFGHGVLIVMEIFALTPVLILAEKGILYSSALEESVLFKLLYPAIQKLVMLMAPFIV